MNDKEKTKLLRKAFAQFQADTERLSEERFGFIKQIVGRIEKEKIAEVLSKLR